MESPSNMPTAADYAWASANDARHRADRNAQTLDEMRDVLERFYTSYQHEIREMKQRIDVLEQKVKEMRNATQA